jgi:hypothetical protein
MQKLTPGSVHIGQIVRHMSATSATVWLQEIGVGMQAYGKTAAGYPEGTLVICRIDAQCRHIDRLRPAPQSIREAYAGKTLLPYHQAGKVLIGQVLDELSDRSVTVWLLDDPGLMVAEGVKSQHFPLGTIVYCRIGIEGGYIDKLRKVPASVEQNYVNKRVIP